MTIYHFAIDETGEFNFEGQSYACGVLISKTEKTIIDKYKEVYPLLFPEKPIPQETKKLINEGEFHYSSLIKVQKSICKKYFSPLVEKIFVSTGKPLLYANNQSYWQIAVMAVILGLFKNQSFTKDDQLNIIIDPRAKKVFGLDTEEITSRNYHNILIKQFKEIAANFNGTLRADFTITLESDKRSFFVNLADIICGVARDKDVDKIQCPCELVQNGTNPSLLQKSNPVGALAVIFQEILTKQFGNIGLIRTILEDSRKNEEIYQQIWDLFYNFLKYQIKQRYTKDNFAKTEEVKKIFLNEFNNSKKINTSKWLDIVNLFVEDISHRGGIEVPFDKNFVLKQINEATETRITRKWEKWVSYHLRLAQVQFNSYNFKLAEIDFEELWAKQDKMINIIGFEPKKDENATAIIGTLAQSFAYYNQLDKAIEYFEMSLLYSIKTSNQTFSYLLACHFLKQNIQLARHFFEKQTGKNAEEFSSSNINEVWCLLAYARLRALELYKNQNTNLPEILPNFNGNLDYPCPLLFKWLAAALFMEDPINHKERISELLKAGIESLLKDTNNFAVRVLVLPLIQFFSLVDNNNPYHAQYNIIFEKFGKECHGFYAYAEQKPFLKSIKNDADLWQRLTALPFIYS